MDFRPIDPIQPLFRGDTAGGVGTAGDSREQGSLFADIFQAAVENVKETERVKNDAEYRLATGQMDNGDVHCQQPVVNVCQSVDSAEE